MKITVITAVYNNVHTISDALQSVVSQSYENIEKIVIDGGSNDGTKSVIERFNSEIDVYRSEADDGIYDALNKGVKLSSGDVIGFLHSDDLFANDQVLSIIAAAFEDQTVDVIYGDLVYVRQENLEKTIRYWRAGDYSLDKLSKGWMPPHPTLYIRKSCYDKLGEFDTTYKIAADYDFILRLFSDESLKVKYIPEVLVKMRVGGVSNRSLKNILHKSREDYTALKSNSIGGIYSLLLKNLSKLPQFFRNK